LSDWLGVWSLVAAELARKGRFDERNQYFLRLAFRVIDGPAAPLDAQGETAEHRVPIAKDVPVLRIDHISAQSSMPGVWRGQRLKVVV
jgi:hypothetical protein